MAGKSILPLRSLSLGEIARVGLVLLNGAGILFSVAVGFEIGWDEGSLCLLATAALTAASLPLLVRRRSELIEPISFVVLIVAIGVTAKSFYVCFGPEKRVEFLLLGKEPGDLIFAALVTAVGLLFLSFGYMAGDVRWRIPGLRRLSAESWDPRRFVGITGAFVAVGLLSFVLFSVQLNLSPQALSDLSSKRFVDVEGSSIRGALGYLRWGATLIEIAFYLVLVRWAASGRTLLSGAGAVVVALAAASVVFPVFTSSRLTLMLMLVRVVVVYVCLRGQPRLRTVVALAATGLVIISAMLAFRRGLSDWEGIRSQMTASALMEVTIGGRHFLDLSKTAQVLDVVPEEMEFQHGKTMLTWLVAPVPRSVWPQKPAIGVGSVLGPQFFQSVATSGVTPGIVGELYLNFGLTGVFVGLLGVGLLLRSLYASLRPHFYSPGVVLIYVLVSTRLALGTLPSSVSDSIVRILKELLPVLLALYLLGRVRRSSSSEVSLVPAAPPSDSG